MATAKELSGVQSHGEAASLISDFNLDTLIEEAVGILYNSHNAPEPVGFLGGGPVLRTSNASQAPKDRDQLSVVIRIEQPHSWAIRSVTSAWRRIVMNVLGNSLKWTKAGFIEVSLSQARDQINPNSALVHLSITDTGRGIAPDFLKHEIFSPFSQEDSLSEGVGLGLSIVRKLVTSLGGCVNVKSELGIGTQVDVYVPVQRVEKFESSVPPP